MNRAGRLSPSQRTRLLLVNLWYFAFALIALILAMATFVLPLWGNGSESAPKGLTGGMIPLGLMAGVMILGGCWLPLRLTKRVRADIREGRVTAFEGPLVKRIDKDSEGDDIYRVEVGGYSVSVRRHAFALIPEGAYGRFFVKRASRHCVGFEAIKEVGGTVSDF